MVFRFVPVVRPDRDVAIIPRSMGTSSGIEQGGATRFSHGLRPADPAAGLFLTPEYVVLLHCLRQKDAG